MHLLVIVLLVRMMRRACDVKFVRITFHTYILKTRHQFWMSATLRHEGIHHKECENIIINWRMEVYSHLNCHYVHCSINYVCYISCI